MPPMSERGRRTGFRHLPVVHGTRVIGMISVGDVVKETMREQTRHNGYLESYINGHGVP